MLEGAVAIIDCLGFKGVWRRADPDHILQQLRGIHEGATKALADGVFRSYQTLGARLRVSFLSDTAIVGVDASNAKNPLSPFDKGRMILWAVQVAQKIQLDLLRMVPPLTVRGCISYGLFDMEGNFILGPAVDEAASFHAVANGAYIWTLPHLDGFLYAARQHMRNWANSAQDPAQLLAIAADAIATFTGSDAAQNFRTQVQAEKQETVDAICREWLRHIIASGDIETLIRYRIELKGGDQLDCFVASPFLITPFKVHNDIVERYNAAMQDNSMGVTVKRQNTLRFLQYAKSRVDPLNKQLQTLASVRQVVARSGQAARRPPDSSIAP